MSSGSVDCYTVISAVEETARTRDKEEAQGAVGVAIWKRLADRVLLRACLWERCKARQGGGV